MHALLKAVESRKLNQADTIAVVTCRKGLIRYLNPVAERFFATDLCGAQARGWAGLLSQAAFEHVQKIESLLLDEASETNQQAVVSGLDQATEFRLTAHVIYDDGEPLGVLWEFFQLPAEATPEQTRLAQQRQRYQRFFHTKSIAQWVLSVEPAYQLLQKKNLHDRQSIARYLQDDPGFFDELRDGIRVLDANQACVDLFESESLTDWKQDFVELLDDTDLIYIGAAIGAIGEDTAEHSFEWQMHTHTEKPLDLWLNVALPTSDQIGGGVLISAVNLAPLKANEAEYEERQQFFATILRAVPDYLFIYDFEQKDYIFANEDMGLGLGYSPVQVQEAGEKFLGYITHPEDQVTHESFNDLRQQLKQGLVYESTLRLQNSDGDWRYFYFRSAALEFDDDGEVRYCVVVARDITEVLKTQKSLNEKERRLRLLEENLSDVILTTDPNLTINYVSPAIKQLAGYRIEEYMALDNPSRYVCMGLADHVSTLVNDYEKALRHCSRLAYEGEDYQRIIETEVQHRDGGRIPVEIKVSLFLGEFRELQGMLILSRDIRERRQVESDLRLAAKVFENSLEGIYITNSEGVITQVNNAFVEITGYSEAATLGRRPAFLSSGWHDQHFVSEIAPLLESAGYWQGELINRRAGGEVFPAWVGITEVRSKADQLLGYITTFRDITEAKSSEQRIRKLAYFDALTDLPNRSLFHDRLSQELQRAQRNKMHVAVLFLDLDRFKAINDSMGHAVGDRLLAEVARRLRECIRGEDTVARMSGDEFTIILSDLADRENAESAAAQVSMKVMRALHEPFLLQGRDTYISTSIGIAMYPQDGKQVDELLKNADTAMYHAKQSGKNAYQFYTKVMNARALERQEFQNSLRRAQEQGEFTLFYQPICTVAQGDVVAAEALLRWRHPQRGVVEPDQFISVIEEMGISPKLGAWVLKEACAQFASWQAQGLPIQRIAVNVSALHFSEGHLVREVLEALDNSSLDAKHLELDFSEAVLMNDIRYTRSMLQDLHAIGVRIAVDDFGTGFSSLEILKRLPVSCLKIDQSFTRQMPKEVEETRITQAIVALAKSFNLSVIAEGVETQQQEDFLLRLGCDEAQGYFYGKPVPGDEIFAYVANS